MSLITEIDETPMSMEQMFDRLALEATVSINMIQQLKETIPGFISNLRGLSESITNMFKQGDEEAAAIKATQGAVLQAVKHIGFLNISDVIVSVPENFFGSFLAYAATLVKTTETIHNTHSELFKEYQVLLSSFATNKDDKISLQDHTAFFKKIAVQREQLNKSVKAFFPSDTGVSKQRLVKVLSRSNDLEALYDQVNKLSKLQSSISLPEIQMSVKKATDLLDIIIDQVQSGKTERVSSAAVMNISTGAFELAKFVEFISVIYFDAMVFMQCVSSLNKTLKSATNS